MMQQGELGCSEEWPTERGAKRQMEGREKVGGKNRRKEADEGIDKKRGRDRKKSGSVLAWVWMQALHGKG